MRLLPSCLVLLSASMVPVSAGETPLPWVARHGLSAADYQKTFEQFSKDFELTSVSAYLDKGRLRYAALWRKPTKAEAWAARHGLSAADFTKAITDLAKGGLSLVYVDGYEVNGTPPFAGHMAQDFRRASCRQTRDGQHPVPGGIRRQREGGNAA